MTEPRLSFPYARGNVIAQGERMGVWLNVPAPSPPPSPSPTEGAVWTSSDPGILSVEAESWHRYVVGNRPGSVMLEVRWRDVCVRQEMHVVDLAVVHELVLDDYVVQRSGLRARAMHDHRWWRDVTDVAQWSSSDDSVARFEVDRPGMPLAGRDGHAIVTVTHGGLSAAREVDSHDGKISIMPAAFDIYGRGYCVRGVTTRFGFLWQSVGGDVDRDDRDLVATADPPGAVSFTLREGALCITGIEPGPVTIGIRLRTLYRERRFEVRDEPITLSEIRLDGNPPGKTPRMMFVGDRSWVSVDLRAPGWSLHARDSVVLSSSDPAVLAVDVWDVVYVADGRAVLRAQCRDVVVEYEVSVVEPPEIQWF